jgi:hypothetical protein
VQRDKVIHGVGFVGAYSDGLQLVAWWRKGGDEDEMPCCPETTLIVATGASCWCYDDGVAIPQPIMEPYAAFGSGSYYADSALALGRTARQAVLHAIQHDVFCGMGTTSIKLRK